MRGEGRSPKITVATGKEAKEPKTYILLVVGQTIGLLSHVTEHHWGIRESSHPVLYVLFRGRVLLLGASPLSSNNIVHSSKIFSDRLTPSYFE